MMIAAPVTTCMMADVRSRSVDWLPSIRFRAEDRGKLPFVHVAEQRRERLSVVVVGSQRDSAVPIDPGRAPSFIVASRSRLTIPPANRYTSISLLSAH